MSRSKKKGKPAGYDFWSARPGNKGGGGSGSDAKKITHRKERMETKKLLQKERHDLS